MSAPGAKAEEPSPSCPTSAAAQRRAAAAAAQLLPARYHARPLEVNDYHKGYFALLTQLSPTDQVSFEAFTSHLREMREAGGVYNPLVIEDLENGGRVVAAATLLVEAKFLRGCSRVGHVEDVVVSKEYRGQKLGARIVDALVALGRARGCYKVILDCSSHNVGFYEKLGFENHGTEMAYYFAKHT